jgi:hypothetical protein
MIIGQTNKWDRKEVKRREGDKDRKGMEEMKKETVGRKF